MPLGMELPRISKKRDMLMRDKRDSSGGEEEAGNAIVLCSLAAQSPEPRYNNGKIANQQSNLPEAQRLNHDAFLVNLRRRYVSVDS